MRKRLTKYSIPEPILRQWEKRYRGRLLPLQYRAVEECGLLDGNSVVISAPTSSGKTFCGEMAVVRALMERKKAVFLVPLKAVAEEKFRQFTDCYGAIGLKVIIGTKDHPEYDSDIENGRFDIGVMVYEKFNSLLLANFDIISQVGTVVVDELQMLADDTRGARLELALTKLLYSEYNPQIVALSAVLGDAASLAKWLGARLLHEKNRPIELRRGVASDGQFAYRCHNSGELGEEECSQNSEAINTLFDNIERECNKGRQVLVFLKSRLETVKAAARYAEYIGLTQDEKNTEFFAARLADEEESSLLDNLTGLLSRGIAFHNADLTMTQRMAVEDGYRAGLLPVVFATTTLATGINLPASTVFIEAQKYARTGYANKSGLEPLSWPEYESMSGRAGRVGYLDGKTETGRAVLFAANELEKSILWEFYIDKQPEPLSSQLASFPVEDIILDAFTSQLVRTAGECNRLLERTYGCACNGLPIRVCDENIKVLLEGGFLELKGDELHASPQGAATAMFGLSTVGARFILSAWDYSSSSSSEELLYDILLCPGTVSFYLPSYGGVGRLHLPERHVMGDNPLLQRLTRLRRELSADEVRRVRIAFLLKDWAEGAAPLDIENDYRLHLGMAENLARQAAWLLYSAASLIRAADRYSSFPKYLERLAFSTGTGLPFKMKAIYDAVDGVLFRREILRLHNEGIMTCDELIESGRAVLDKIVSSEARLTKIKEKLKNIKELKMRKDGNQFDTLNVRIVPESIEIDGTPIRERFRIRINGQSINLTGKSFKYFCRLAWSRVTNDNGWLYKEELEQGFNQARYLYRLRQEIGRDFLPDWPLYENNRSGYYRLAIPSDKISINVNALKENPDYEIREIVSDLAPDGAC
ncbi:MAG: DEAD/DEAH box helicase [candidate division Zixibacteria bacterium]|nr:DEAD/DEAH box helicase [candidate division Zixibacteria bacterium]